MLECIENKGAPTGLDAALVKRAIARHMPHLAPGATSTGATSKRRK
jgi:hypothetical protein